MPQYPTREEAIHRDLVPAIRAIGLDPDDYDLEAIARKTVNSSRVNARAAVWQNNAEGERLRVIAEQHRRA